MTNNCLKTQLKSVVNNDNLPLFGKIKFNFSPVTNPDYSMRYLGVSDNVSNPTIKGGTFVDAQGASIGTTYPIEVGASNNMRISNDDCYVIVDNYKLIALTIGQGGTLNINDLEYSPIVFINVLENGKVSGNMAVLSNKTLTSFIINGENAISGNINNITISNGVVFKNNISTVGSFNYGTSVEGIIIDNSAITLNLSDISSLQSLQTLSTNGAINITGDVANLATCTSLTRLLIRESGCYGTLESMCEGMLGNGKTSSLSITAAESRITLNNTLFFTGNYGNYVIDFGVNSVEIKQGSTVIASYNGTSWTYN